MSRFERLARLRQRYEDEAAAAMGRAAANVDAIEQGLDDLTESVRDVLTDRQTDGWSLRARGALTESFIHHRRQAEHELTEARVEAEGASEAWATARRDRKSMERLGERIDDRAEKETVQRRNRELDDIVTNRFGGKR
ncbi:MAG: flagellar export protein FliJ [Actinomycetia bacterium]|nr:flagellar export protein FliJ [Actinomycetes bacterium]